MRVLAIDGSPAGAGRTVTVLEAVLAAAASAGAETTLLGLAATDGVETAVSAIEALAPGDALVLGTPIYRATYAAPLKALLDAVPRDFRTGDGPLRARAVGIVATGASLHHFLGLNELRTILAAFFAAHVVPPGLYVPRQGFDDTAEGAPVLAAPHDAEAAVLGAALVALGHVLEAGGPLAQVAPQA